MQTVSQDRRHVGCGGEIVIATRRDVEQGSAEKAGVIICGLCLAPIRGVRKLRKRLRAAGGAP